MTMLTDHFTHKVDEKGRVSFPASFRKEFSSNLKVIRSLTDNCLMVFSAEYYEDYINELFDSKGGYCPTDRSHIKLMRFLTTNAADVEIDKAGRIGLKADLRSLVGIEDVAVIAGNRDHVEIWGPEAWDEFNGDITADDLGDFFTN